MSELDATKALDSLPTDQKDALYRELLMKRLSNRNQLRQWCKTFISVDLADCTVSRYATSNPLDMVWDIYEFCLLAEVDENLDPQNRFYIAGRSSQKTLSTAVLQILLPLHFGRSFTHFGGTQDQARRAYIYAKSFLSKKYVSDFLKTEPTQQSTIFTVNQEDVLLEILSISPMAVQGPHSPVVSLDELGSLSPDKIRAYGDVAGIPIYTKDGKPWIKFGISSRKGKHTIIETEYDNRQKSGTIFKFWTVLENTARCPDSLSGTEPLEMYVNPIENKVMLEKEFIEFSESKPNEAAKFDKVMARDKCITCPLAAQCGGDLKNQTSTAKTLRPARATIQQFKGASSLEWWLSQSMSMTPSAEGAVFPKFKREAFEKTPNEIYEIFMGEPAGADITEDRLIEVMIAAGVKRFAGLDHGYTHPEALVVVYEDSRGNAYIMASIEIAGLEPQEVIDMVRTAHNKYKFTVLYPDTEAPSINKAIQNAKPRICRVHTDFKKDIEKGITAIRGKLSPTVGHTKLFGVKGSVDTMTTNFEKYHYATDSAGKLTDDVVDVEDDSMAALRYIAQNRWESTGRMIIGKDTAIKETPDETKVRQNQAIADSQTNWLKKEIAKSIQTGGDVPPTTKAKSGGGFWGF